jgi:hypothetical protein
VSSDQLRKLKKLNSGTVLVLLAAVALAPAHAGETSGSVTAPRFYVVQADGKSRAEDPVRSGFAVSPDQRLSGTGQAVRQESNPPPRQPPGSDQLTPPVTIRISGAKHTVPERDEFAAFRCERLGFYYTTDGRCVAPAGTQRPRHAPSGSRPPASGMR